MAELDIKYENRSGCSLKNAFSFFFMLVLMLGINPVTCAQERSLNDYLDAAKANSPALLEYENNARIADLENEKVIADYRYPELHTDVNWMEAPVIDGVGYDESITNGAWYSALAGVSMPLFTKALSKPRLEKNRLEAGKSQWQGKMGWEELKLQITDQYAQCYADQLKMDNVKAQLTVITDQHRISTKLAQQGIVKASDVLQLGIEMSSQKVRLREQHSTFRNHLNKLNNSCGITDTTLYRFAPPDLVLSGSITDSSSFLRQFYYDSLSILNQQDLFNMKYKPKVSAFADAGLNAVDLKAPQNSLGFSFGLKLSMNLWDHNQHKITAKQTEIRLNTTTAYRTYFEKSAHNN